jgi:SAM-dependent methyltransferase
VPGDDFDVQREAVYGRRWAPLYDEIIPAAETSTIDLLDSFAEPSRRALELAIGTGRLAVPLAGRGVSITGVDISEDMVSRLHAKPEASGMRVVMADMAHFEIGETFPLAYLAFNTLFALRSQARQVACFRTVAAHLEPGGRFVLDCFVPDVTRYDAYHTRMAVSSITSDDTHAYEMSIHDPVTQMVTSHHVRRLADGTNVVLPVTVRYAWPSEMDLMAELAGLRLEVRYGWYDRRPFTETSKQHVSVYVKTG